MFKNPSIIDVVTRMFSPGEVERISGVKAGTIRSWRSKGWIHRNAVMGSVNGFHLIDLCEISLLNVFSKSGGSIEKIYGHSSAMAGHIYQNLMQFPAIWDTEANFGIYCEEKHPGVPKRFGIISDTAIKSTDSVDAFLMSSQQELVTVIDLAKVAFGISEQLSEPIATLTALDLINDPSGSYFVNRATGKRAE